MKKKLLISACFLGIPCRYDGRSVKAEWIKELSEKYDLIPVCPEVYGGLPTPRVPSERVGDRVVMRDGCDVSENFLLGARAAYEIAVAAGCDTALLKERSPSCGSGSIYDGSFTGKLVDGDGVTSEYLKGKGIGVYGESLIDEILK